MLGLVYIYSLGLCVTGCGVINNTRNNSILL
jgi:hypothetical protein